MVTTRNIKRLAIIGMAGMMFFLWYTHRQLSDSPSRVKEELVVKMDQGSPFGDGMGNLLKKDKTNDADFVPIKKVPEDNDFGPLPVFDVPLQNVPSSFLQESLCPACFGNDRCDAISNGKIKIDTPLSDTPLSKRGIYFGLEDGKKPVMLKIYPHRPLFDAFDKFVCHNASKEIGCDVAKTVVDSTAVHEDVFKGENLRKLFRVVHQAPAKLPNVACATQELTSYFTESIDDMSNFLTPSQRAQLLTSIAVYPEAINFRVMTILESGWPFPEQDGACGRALVMTHYGKPLAEYLDQSWTDRAYLALQLLQIVESFSNTEPVWFIAYSGFSYDNIQVTNDNKVVLIDAQDLMFIDQSDMDDYTNLDEVPVCNDDCFVKAVTNIYDGKDGACKNAPTSLLNAMYAIICREIFLKYQHTTKGLLHSIPETHRDKLTSSLRECVTETASRGRLTAVDEIMEILDGYIADDGNHDWRRGAVEDDGRE